MPRAVKWKMTQYQHLKYKEASIAIQIPAKQSLRLGLLPERNEDTL